MPTRSIFAVYRAGGLRSPTTSAMVEVLEQVCAAAPGRRTTELRAVADG